MAAVQAQEPPPGTLRRPPTLTSPAALAGRVRPTPRGRRRRGGRCRGSRRPRLGRAARPARRRLRRKAPRRSSPATSAPHAESAARRALPTSPSETGDQYRAVHLYGHDCSQFRPDWSSAQAPRRWDTGPLPGEPCRSSSRSLALNARIRPVTSPIMEETARKTPVA